MKEHEDLLICDLAETYGIFHYKTLPATLVASFTLGLREDSRIKMKFSGAEASNDILLLAAAVDRLSLLVWAQTKDAEKNRNRPKSIVEEISRSQDSFEAFTSGKEFEKYRQKIVTQIELERREYGN